MSKRYKLEAELKNIVESHLGFQNPDGTDYYWLSRCKTGFAVGTVTIDDFIPLDEDIVGEIMKDIMTLIDKKYKHFISDIL